MKLQIGQTVMTLINLFFATVYLQGSKIVKKNQFVNDEKLKNEAFFLAPPVIPLEPTLQANQYPQKIQRQIQTMKYSSMKTYFPYFQSFVIAKEYPLLENDTLKNIITNCLQSFVRQRKIKVFAFVIMPNHIDIIWSIESANEKANATLMNNIGNLILEYLSLNNPMVLSHFEIASKKHLYNFWEKNIQSTPLYSPFDWQETLDNIHNTPVDKKWCLAALPENYQYSSAKFYEHGIDDFGIISHWPGCY